MNNILYIYLDPRKPGFWHTSEFTFDHEPFYVGEGKISRQFDHLKDRRRSHKTNRIREIFLDNLKPIILVLKENLTKKESTDFETDLIKQIGTRVFIEGVLRGPLTNLRLYGRKGLISNETKVKISVSKKGIKFSDEHRAKLSTARAGRSYKRDPLGPLSEEHKRKLSLANLGKTRTNEAKERMSRAQSGRLISEEHRKKLSESCKGRESPNVKSWKIEYESEEPTIIVDRLRDWCIENGIIYSSLRNSLSGKFYRGMKLARA